MQQQRPTASSDCAKHNLFITNTVFHLPTRNKISWMRPHSKHRHLIDYVIVRVTDRRDVRVMKAMCGVECWTDHCLMISKLSSRVQPKTRPQGKKAPKRLNIMKLKDVPTKQLFIEALNEGLDTIFLDEQNVEAAWITLRDTVYSTAIECLGPSTRRRRDCIHDTIQLKLHEMLDSWLCARADEIQGYADKNDMKNFYSSLKGVYCPTSAGSLPLLSVDGIKLISEKIKILER